MWEKNILIAWNIDVSPLFNFHKYLNQVLLGDVFSEYQKVKNSIIQTAFWRHHCVGGNKRQVDD